MNLQLAVGIGGFVLSTVLNYPMIVGLYSLWRKSRSGELLYAPVPWPSISMLYFVATLVVKSWGAYTLFFNEIAQLMMAGSNIIFASALVGSVLADLIIVWFQSEKYLEFSPVNWVFHWCNLMVSLWESGWMMVFALLQAAALLVAGFYLVIFSV